MKIPFNHGIDGEKSRERLDKKVEDGEMHFFPSPFSNAVGCVSAYFIGGKEMERMSPQKTKKVSTTAFNV